MLSSHGSVDSRNGKGGTAYGRVREQIADAKAEVCLLYTSAFGEKLAALFTPGSHGSTFAGNPLGAAAGLATLDVIEDENLVANAEARGEQLRDGIMATGNPLFVSVRGRGSVSYTHLVARFCRPWPPPGSAGMAGAFGSHR